MAMCMKQAACWIGTHCGGAAGVSYCGFGLLRACRTAVWAGTSCAGPVLLAVVAEGVCSDGFTAVASIPSINCADEHKVVGFAACL